MTRGSRLETEGADNAEMDGTSLHSAAAIAATVDDVWQRRWFIIRAAMLAGTLAIVVALLLPNKYTATAQLLPSGGGSSLGSLARGFTGQLADLGLGPMMQASDPGESSELFPQVLTSRTLSDEVLKRSYTIADGETETSMDLYEYFDEKNADYAYKALHKITSVHQERTTGVITLSVTTRHADLSRQIATAFVEELEAYNSTRRRTKGTEKAAFLAGRLDAVEKELESASMDLKVFRSRNLNFANSSDPDILAELARLQRNETIKTELFGLLTQQHEMARLEAADQMPIVQVLDRPRVPLVKSSPPRTVIVISTGLVAVMIATLIAIAMAPARRVFPENPLVQRAASFTLKPAPRLRQALRLKRGREKTTVS